MSFGSNCLYETKVIIPTYNAAKYLEMLIPALETQGLSRANILVVDSSSADQSVQRFSQFGAKVEVIPQSEFDHGGTRRWAASLCSGASYLILLTQDAIPSAPETFSRILDVFKNDQIGMAYGRQLPRPQARAIERHARLANYPAQSELRSLGDRKRLGIKTIFCSDSFAAYRTTALEAIGGFPEEAFFAEDQIVAARMLLAGWSIAYCAEAQVVHSHGYTVLQDFRRYFDVGVFHARNHWILENFGSAEGAGTRFLIDEFRYLLLAEPSSIPSAMLRTLAKYFGYRLGRVESRLPASQKRRLSQSPYYWSKASNNSK